MAADRSGPAQVATDLLRGRSVLVTGASGAIGAAISAAVRRHGANCYGIDLTASDAVAQCDITDPDAVRAALSIGVTDVVHAAGILSVGSVCDTTIEEFRRVIDVNLTGSFIVAQAAARMLPRGGSITLVSSQAGLKTGGLWCAYAAAKAGVIRLVETLARELGSRGIRANAICPGNVDSPMGDAALTRLSELTAEPAAKLRERGLAEIALGRFATPEEIGEACAFLASPMASYISGIALLVDGGELSG